MTYDPDKHHRRSIRLKEYDYSRAGAYFITICTYNKECILGDVIHGEMKPNEYGVIVENEWVKTAEIRPNVIIDKYMVMPNHVHGIIIILDDGRDTVLRVPTFEQFGRPTSNSIPTIIRSFKAVTKKRINEVRKSYGKTVWQPRFYEHIIRNKDELDKIRQYVALTKVCPLDDVLLTIHGSTGSPRTDQWDTMSGFDGGRHGRFNRGGHHERFDIQLPIILSLSKGV